MAISFFKLFPRDLLFQVILHEWFHPRRPPSAKFKEVVVFVGVVVVFVGVGVDVVVVFCCCCWCCCEALLPAVFDLYSEEMTGELPVQRDSVA